MISRDSVPLVTCFFKLFAIRYLYFNIPESVHFFGLVYRFDIKYSW